LLLQSSLLSNPQNDIHAYLLRDFAASNDDPSLLDDSPNPLFTTIQYSAVFKRVRDEYETVSVRSLLDTTQLGIPQLLRSVHGSVSHDPVGWDEGVSLSELWSG
jgi:hypothetical protein